MHVLYVESRGDVLECIVKLHEANPSWPVVSNGTPKVFTNNESPADTNHVTNKPFILVATITLIK